MYNIELQYILVLVLLFLFYTTAVCTYILLILVVLLLGVKYLLLFPASFFLGDVNDVDHIHINRT